MGLVVVRHEYGHAVDSQGKIQGIAAYQSFNVCPIHADAAPREAAGPCQADRFEYKSPNDMALPHPKSRKDEYGKEDKPGGGGVIWNFFKRRI
jgi:hypothetical protein